MLQTLTIDNFDIKDAILFISKHTATRVTKGVIHSIDRENQELIVKYRDVHGVLTKNRVRPKDAIKQGVFSTTGKLATHAFCIVNIRGRIVVTPIHTLSDSGVIVTVGGYQFGYRRTSVQTGNIVRC